MLMIFRNYISRLSKRKNILIVYIVMSVLAIIAGLYLSDQKSGFRIGVVSSQGVSLKGNDVLQVEALNHMPPKSALVLQKYDAVVEMKNDGSYQLYSIRNAEDNMMLQNALDGNVMKQGSHERGKGTMILGYVMMFVMMQSIAYLMLFGEDKEHHMLERLQVTPLKPWGYVLSVVLLASLMTMLPAFLCLCAASLFHISIGFTLLQFFLLLLILSLLSVSVAFFINTMIYSADSANMITSAIFVLTSALSGCFLPLSGTWAETLSKLFPQHQLLDIAAALEKGGNLQQSVIPLFYVAGIIAICFVLGILRCRRIFRIQV